MQARTWSRGGALAVLAVAACSRGGDGGSTAPGSTVPFGVVSIDLDPSGVSELDRPLRIRFSRSVDFTSIDANSIALADVSGVPAVYEMRSIANEPREIELQPRCPLLADLSDAGLRLATKYELLIDEVRALDGTPLAASVRREFETPANPALAFFDAVSGAPRLVARDAGSADDHTSRVEIGFGETLAYFERDAQGVVALQPPVELPLNLYSALATHVAFVLAFDQSPDPAPENLALIALEFRGDVGAWQPLVCERQIVGLCEPGGALVRVEPRGALPAECELRVVLRAGFRDRVGKALASDVSELAGVPTSAATSPLVDDVLEDFGSNALEDEHATFADPRADWGGGELALAREGDQVGGPGGDFDWLVPTGAAVMLETAHTTLIGGPGFVPTGVNVVESGLLEVRNLRIEAGALVRVRGPHALTILASGDVTIDGVLDVSGESHRGVTGLTYGGAFKGPGDITGPAGTHSTIALTQPGALGVAGGGNGGAGHPVRHNAVEFGGTGQGAFATPDRGGFGGETCWSLTPNLNARRGAGAGGGRFGPDAAAVVGTGAFDQRRIGLDAEKGFDNLIGDHGAGNPSEPPHGGASGASPFVDGDPSNDFFGLAIDPLSGARVVGELLRPWAGSGGGGGGDGVRIVSGTFPPPPSPTVSLHGGGGGGGGGSLRIVALGRVRIGATGRILARGGSGGGGANTIFLNRIGGAGGGGSGGHVILESAQQIEFTTPLGSHLPILATGGQGGAGSGDIGGAIFTNNGAAETFPNQDACPPGYPISGWNACKGHIHGAGGDGGPGVVQLHVPRGIDDILLPPGKTLADMCQPPPLCDWGDTHLVPSIALRSRARSQWIALGRGGFDAASGIDAPLDFEFEGTDPGSGRVLAFDELAWLAPPILGPHAIQTAPATPSIGQHGRALIVDASAWLGTEHELLLERTDLLLHTTITLRTASLEQRFDVVAAERYGATALLTLTVNGDGPRLDTFAPGGVVEASLHPSWLRVATDGVSEVLSSSTWIRIGFQTTQADALGLPDEIAATELLYDAAALDWYAQQADPHFVRFDCTLATTPEFGVPGLRSPTLDFLRLRFAW